MAGTQLNPQSLNNSRSLNSTSTSLNRDISLRSLRRSQPNNTLRNSNSDESMNLNSPNLNSGSRPLTPVENYSIRQNERLGKLSKNSLNFNSKGKERDSDGDLEGDEIDLLGSGISGGSGKRGLLSGRRVIRGEGEVEGSFDQGWKGGEGEEERSLLGLDEGTSKQVSNLLHVMK